MSAVIIPFPEIRPSRKEIEAGMSLARRFQDGVGSAERKIFMAGFAMGWINGGSKPTGTVPSAPKRRRVSPPR